MYQSRLQDKYIIPTGPVNYSIEIRTKVTMVWDHSYVSYFIYDTLAFVIVGAGVIYSPNMFQICSLMRGVQGCILVCNTLL